MGRLLRAIAAFVAVAGVARAETPDAPAAFGSADFRCSLARPFGWRGDGTGCFPGATPATEWSATKNVRWSTIVGSGYSSPVLAEGCVFVTAEPDKLICIDRSDGKIRWQLSLTPAELPDAETRRGIADYIPPKDGSGLAAATPVTDGRNVYALFANGLLAAVDLQGHRQWTTGIVAPPSTGYGRSASPIIVAGKIIVHMTHLFAFDPADGHQLWVNTDAQSSYGTPAPCRAGDTDLILTSLGDLVRASDGKTLASGLGHTSQSSPIASDGLLIFGDSDITALRLDATFKDTPAWNATVPGDIFGSPLLHDGLLFIVTGDGALSIVDATGTGPLTPIVESRALLPDSAGSTPAAYASLTLAGRHLFLTSNDGDTVVLEATREARLVARSRLPAGTGASPVFSGTALFLRAGDALWCIGK